MLLEDKNAVVYGGGGSVGGAVARAFSREGANVFLAGRTLARVEAVAEEISAAGGRAEAAQLDALDEQAVEEHIGEVAGKAESIDILFNAIGMEDVQGTPLLDMPLEDFARPVIIATRSQFLTARLVARRMIRQGSGVNNAVARVAGLLAVAVLGLFVYGAFSANLDARLEGLDLPGGVRSELEAAKADLGAAEAPEGVDAGMAAQIEHAIDESFVAGFRAVMLVCAGLALASALAAALLIGDRRARRTRYHRGRSE